MTVHCWADLRDTLPFGSEEWVNTFETGNATCMLEDGHLGPHEWTPDDEIGVSFERTPSGSEGGS